jgi:Tfp pilus assembly protein PilX
MKRRLWRSDDRGASLVFALIFVTSVALVVGVVLALADTSIRTTIAVRDQAAAAANADGAAQIAINKLRQSNFVFNSGNDCFGTGVPLTVSDFYSRPGGPSDSAAVTCATDDTNSDYDPSVLINTGNKPGSAILTLGTSTSEDGLYVKVSGGRTLKVHGKVTSKSNINVDLGTLDADTSVRARTNCTGTINTPIRNCNDNVADISYNDPDYPAPAAPTVEPTVPTCTHNGEVITFSPGLYTGNSTLNKLNNLTKSNGCTGAIFWFQPGTYYFDFNNSWKIDTGYVVGGTPSTPLVNNHPPDIPGACMAPIPPNPVPEGGWKKPPANAGVQFVLGGKTQIQVSATQMELCGTYSTSSPPVTIYGLKSGLGSAPFAVSAQSGCTITVSGRCATLSSDNSPNSHIYIQGTTYVSNGWINLSFNNSTGQVFRYGVVARSLSLNPTGSPDLSYPVIEVPDDAPAGALRTVLYLSVYVCQGKSSCDTSSGTLRLKVKVAVSDPTGEVVAGKREITVLSWSVVR